MKATLPKVLTKLPWLTVATKDPSVVVIKAAARSKARRKVTPMTKAEADAFERSINEIFEREP